MKTTTNYSYDFMRNVTKIETKDESGFLHERVDYDYMYDSTKRKLLMKVEKRKDNIDNTIDVTVTSYDQKTDQPALSRILHATSEGIIQNQCIEYFYNDNGVIIREESYINGFLEYIDNYDYVEKDVRYVTTKQFNNGTCVSKIINRSTVTHSEVPNGEFSKMIITEGLIDTDGLGYKSKNFKSIDKTIRIYDKLDRLIKTEYTQDEGKSGTVTTREYDSDERKHCTEIVEFINNGEHTKKIIRNIDYKYNDNGDMITSICDEEIINNY